MNKRSERVEKIYAVAVLLYASGAFFRTFYGMYDPAAGASTGSFMGNLIWAAIYLSSAWLLKTRCDRFWPPLFNMWPLLSMYLVVFVSIAWSDAPLLSFLRFGALAGSTIFGLYFGARFSLKMQLILLGWTYGIATSLSIVFSLLLPSYSIGTDPFAGMWLGIYQHKNILGMNMAMAFLVFLTLAYCFPAKRWHFRLLACIAIVVIYLANSATSFVECAVMCWVFPFLARLRPSDQPRRASTFLLVASGVPLILSPFVLYVPIVTALGRDVELTGRLGMWYLVAQQIAQRPLLGYGYFAFWRGIDGPLGQLTVLGGISSHDGLLDIWLDLGLLGVIVLLTTYLIYAGRSLRILKLSRKPEDIWPPLLFSWVFFSNLTESTFLRPNRFPWMMVVVAAATVCLRQVDNARNELHTTPNLQTNALGF